MEKTFDKKLNVKDLQKIKEFLKKKIDEKIILEQMIEVELSLHPGG